MIEVMFLILGSLLGVVFLSLMERKILSIIQMRLGPNKVGLWGLVQSVVDAVKLFSKEQMKLKALSQIMYMLNCIGLIFLSLVLWIFLPTSSMSSSFTSGLLILVLILGLESYFLLFMGWMSSDKFSMLGGLRGLAVVISYEVLFFLVILSLAFFLSEFDLLKLKSLQLETSSLVWLYWALLGLVMMILLSEMNRSPMDLTEGESELVSGFNIEYMSFGLSMIFISEFSKMAIMMMVFMGLMMGGGLFIMGVSMMLMLLLIRASFPRFRYDTLMYLCWKISLPVMMGVFLLFFCF